MNGTAGGWISESLKIHKMQVTWAVKNEMARTVEDVLARRTRALVPGCGGKRSHLPGSSPYHG
jgi:glycerol-3-phosphate dehydrogenase